jgi:very-short-patch-repair endonuclease
MYRNKDQRDFARHLCQNMTDAERRLWSLLRCEQLKGFKFRRQAAIGRFVVDLISFRRRLVIELDGGQHNDPAIKRYDDARTEWLKSQGFHVLRFWNHDVLENYECVVEVIWNTLVTINQTPPSPALPTEGREPE